MRAKDEAVIKALESGRAEHAEAHLSVVKQYEGTIAELQTSLAAARAKISSVEAQYAHSMQEATEQNKSIESKISADQKLHMELLSQGLEEEVGKTQEARRAMQRSRGELDEKARELRDSEVSNRVAQQELRGHFLEQMQAMRVEIAALHSHELAAERARIAGLEERSMSKDAKYHAIADELRRHEERNRSDRAHLRKARDRCDRLSLEVGSLAALRDELRARVSELTVRLSTEEQTSREQAAVLVSKESELVKALSEIDKLRKERETSQTSPAAKIGPPPVVVASNVAANTAQHSVKEVLKETARLRNEVQTLRLSLAEKDFRIGALREIVGGLERMVPTG